MDPLLGEAGERLVRVVPAVEAQPRAADEQGLAAGLPGVMGEGGEIDRELVERIHELARRILEAVSGSAVVELGGRVVDDDRCFVHSLQELFLRLGLSDASEDAVDLVAGGDDARRVVRPRRSRVAPGAARE